MCRRNGVDARIKSGHDGSRDSAGGAEAARPTICGAERLHDSEFDMSDGRHHQLGDALRPVHPEGLVAEIGKKHHDFAAIVGVDGAGTVEHGDAAVSYTSDAADEEDSVD